MSASMPIPAARMADPNNAGLLPRCPRCDYIVLGLPDDCCPECGETIDWGRAYDNGEQRRIGSPVYRARGLAIIPATVRTVLLLLFQPGELAWQLRWDEPILPAVCVAVAAFLPVGYECGGRDSRAYVAGITACMLCNCLAFAVLGVGRAGSLRWWQRFRLFGLVSLYATCFVATWVIVKPPLLAGLTSAEFLWPADNFPDKLSKLLIDWEFVGRSVIFYWWWGILLALAFVRMRPRWRAVLMAPVPAGAACAGYYAGLLVY